MDKIKVLMVGPARNVKGGMTSVVDNYFKYGLDKAVELKYIESINDGNKISKFIKEKKGFYELKKNINEFDIIHIHIASRRSTFRKSKYIRLAKKYNKSVILHAHGAEFKQFYDCECNNKQKNYIKETFNMADKVIVLSEEWMDFFSNIVEKEKIIVIYNAIVIPDDFEKDTNTQKALFLGKLGKRKGIYDLIYVVEKICKKYPKFTLYVGGDGETEKVKKIVKEKQLENNIKILGWVSGKQKEKLLKECSFYILPSYNEGMPMSVIEGMAYKNITISTKVGGIPKIIKNLENGIIINPGDKESMYKYLSELLDNDDLKNKLSVAGRKTIEEKFNIENSISKIIEIYNAIKNLIL